MNPAIASLPKNVNIQGIRRLNPAKEKTPVLEFITDKGNFRQTEDGFVPEGFNGYGATRSGYRGWPKSGRNLYEPKNEATPVEIIPKAEAKKPKELHRVSGTQVTVSGNLTGPLLMEEAKL